MGKFESFIQNSVSNYKAEYNASSWEQLEKQLPKNNQSKWLWVGGLSAAAVLTGVVLFSVTNQEHPTVKEIAPSPIEQVEQSKTAAPQQQDPKNNIAITPITKEVDSQSSLAYDTTKSKPAILEDKAIIEDLVVINPIPEETTKTLSEGISATVKISKTNACVNEPILFEATVNAPCSYIWRFGDGGSSNLPTPVYSYASTGKFKYNLTVTNLLDGTKHNIYGEKEISIAPKPHGAIEYDINKPENYAQKVDFYVTGKDINTISWELNNKKFTGNNNALELNQKGNYPATAIITNSYGCKDTLHRAINIVTEYNLLAPNAFTPNGDGYNDIFIPKALEGNANIKYTLSVIDPSGGQVIFRGDQTTGGWNGINILTGAIAASKNYTWLATVYLKDGSTKVFKGSLNIVD